MWQSSNAMQLLKKCIYEWKYRIKRDDYKKKKQSNFFGEMGIAL